MARRADNTWDLAHRIAMEPVFGRRLTGVENVRHRDGDRGNLAQDDLELITLSLLGPGRARRRRARPLSTPALPLPPICEPVPGRPGKSLARRS